MKRRMLMVISPAKKLAEGAINPDIPTTEPRMLDEAETLVERLREMDSFELANLMKLSMKLADLNVQRYQAWQRPFTPENAQPALFMFRGDVYQTLDADTLSPQSLEFAQAHLRILSGLYGVLRPLDRIQPYRLEMGTRLTTERGRTLYEFWGDRITEALMADSEPPRLLINLASNEYFKAVRRRRFDGRILTLTFKEAKGNDYRTIGLFAKRARGSMVRYILEHQITEPEEIRTFDRDGYRFNPEQSGDDEWVFTREG